MLCLLVIPAARAAGITKEKLTKFKQILNMRKE